MKIDPTAAERKHSTHLPLDEMVHFADESAFHREHKTRVCALERDEFCGMGSGVADGFLRVQQKIIDDHADVVPGDPRGLDFQIRVDF